MESKEKHYWSLPFCPEFTSETPGVIITRQRCAIGPFHRKNGEDFDIHCSSGGFDREGELMLSLSFNNTPVARLSFSVIPSKKGHCAFIGGLQGAPKILAQTLFVTLLKPAMDYSLSGSFLRFFVH